MTYMNKQSMWGYMQYRKDFSEEMIQTIGIQRRSSHMGDRCRVWAQGGQVSNRLYRKRPRETFQKVEEKLLRFSGWKSGMPIAEC